MLAVKHLIWLIGLTVAGIWQLYEISAWPSQIQSLLPFMPYFIASLGVFISLYLNRLQPILLFLTLVAVNFAIGYLSPEGTSLLRNLSAQTLYPVIAMLLPLNLLVWSMMPERGIQDKFYLLLITFVFAAQGYGVFWVMEHLPINILAIISQPVVGADILIPMIPLTTIIFIWLLMVMRNALSETSKILDKTVVFVLILTAVALNEFETLGAVAWLTSVASVLVLLTIVFDAHHIAYTDQLTGINARRALLESFLGLGRRYAISMMDIDHFKSFNDRYGHDTGDKVLKTVAQALTKVSAGKAYRYGGEEFTIVFHRKNSEQAKEALEIVRQQIEAIELDVVEKGQPKKTKVTVSFGVAEKNDTLKKPEQVLKAADEALYQAKEDGRNQVVIYGESPKKGKKTTKKPRVRTRTKKGKQNDSDA